MKRLVAAAGMAVLVLTGTSGANPVPDEMGEDFQNVVSSTVADGQCKSPDRLADHFGAFGLQLLLSTNRQELEDHFQVFAPTWVRRCDECNPYGNCGTGRQSAFQISGADPHWSQTGFSIDSFDAYSGAQMEARVVTSGPDLEQVRTLFQEYAEWIAIDLSFQGFAEELAKLPGDYNAPHGTLLLGIADAAPVGCIAVRRWRDDTCEMKRLYVRPAHRGRGGGLFLTNEAIDWAIKAGYRRMVLDTLPTMTFAQRLYDRLGFRDIAPYRYNPVPGSRFMARELKATTDAE